MLRASKANVRVTTTTSLNPYSLPHEKFILSFLSPALPRYIRCWIHVCNIYIVLTEGQFIHKNTVGDYEICLHNRIYFSFGKWAEMSVMFFHLLMLFSFYRLGARKKAKLNVTIFPRYPKTWITSGGFLFCRGALVNLSTSVSNTQQALTSHSLR